MSKIQNQKSVNLNLIYGKLDYGDYWHHVFAVFESCLTKKDRQAYSVTNVYLSIHFVYSKSFLIV